jgi:hypothetical protein
MILSAGDLTGYKNKEVLLMIAAWGYEESKKHMSPNDPGCRKSLVVKSTRYFFEKERTKGAIVTGAEIANMCTDAAALFRLRYKGV